MFLQQIHFYLDLNDFQENPETVIATKDAGKTLENHTERSAKGYFCKTKWSFAADLFMVGLYVVSIEVSGNVPINFVGARAELK